MNIVKAFVVANEYRRTVAHMEFVRQYWDEVTEIKGYLANDEADAAIVVFTHLPEAVQIGLWRATTKGGCWTIEERRALKPETRTEEP